MAVLLARNHAGKRAVTETDTNLDIQEEPTPEDLKRLSPTVKALGFVSLFTDMSSEMAYTQIPLFLTNVLGVSKATVGLIEGVAESTASLLRLVSGYVSDKVGKRKPLILAGYGLGAISKPLLALAASGATVGGLRFLDRLGKGLRTAPRDALIAENTPKAIRGRAFGLHRTMDTTGAVLGPLLGAWFLTHISPNLRHLFLFAGLPGLLAVLTLVFAVREGAGARGQGREKTGDERQETGEATQNPKSQIQNPMRLPRWSELTPEYRRFLLVVLLFNLGNSSDTFLILRASGAGFGNVAILWLYAAFNGVEAVLGYSAGSLSDRVGRKPLIVCGYFIFALVYAGFALAGSKPAIVALFLLYGGYYTLTQGTQRAFAADLADPAQRATQIGAYHTVVGVALLPASVLAGWLFDRNPAAPFAVGAVTALVSAFLLLLPNPRPLP